MSQTAARLALLFALVTLGLAPACAPPGDDAGPEVDEFEPPPAPEHGVQLSIPSFTLASGEETERCVMAKAPAPIGGIIQRVEMVARAGLHHTVIYKVGQDLDPNEVDCFGLPDDAMEGFMVPEPLFASTSQVTEETLEFPEGVGVAFEANQQIIFNFHYINVTSEEIEAEVFVNLHYYAEDEEVEEARFYAFGNMGGIDIPAGHSQRLTTTCNFPSDMNLFSATPHMHRLGTAVEVRFNNDGNSEEVLLDDAGWAGSASLYLDPPRAVTPADGLTFTCEWTNTTENDVSFGPTFDDEMCFVFGFVYPASGPVYAFDYNEGCVTDESVID